MTTSFPAHVSTTFFFKEIGFIAGGWLQHVHNHNSVKTVPVTSYIEILQNVVLYLFSGGGVRCSSEKLTLYKISTASSYFKMGKWPCKLKQASIKHHIGNHFTSNHN